MPQPPLFWSAVWGSSPWGVWASILHEPREPVLGEVVVGNEEMATRNPHASRAWCEVPFSGNSGDYCTGRESCSILPSKVSLSAPALSSLLLLCSRVPKAASRALVPSPLTPKAAAHRVGLGKGRAGLGWTSLGGWLVGSWYSSMSSPLRSMDHMAVSFHEQGLPSHLPFLKPLNNTCVM